MENKVKKKEEKERVKKKSKLTKRCKMERKEGTV